MDVSEAGMGRFGGTEITSTSLAGGSCLNGGGPATRIARKDALREMGFLSDHRKMTSNQEMDCKEAQLPREKVR